MTKHLTIRQPLAKIPSFPYLYRHRINGWYYGVKRLQGKEKDHLLDTTDKKEAERNPKDWLDGLDTRVSDI
jgi:hypothetical protein